jgi:hypothetical protein
MDWLTFISDLVKASLWPIVVIVAMLSFRKEVRALLKQLRKGKVGAAEFEFEKALLELPPAKPPLQMQDYNAVLRPPRLPRSDTRWLIADSWYQLENSVRDLLRSRNLPESLLPQRATGLARALTELKVLAPDQSNLFLDLRRLSIQAANDPRLEPSAEAALNFVQSADQLRMEVEHAARHSSSIR